MSGALKFTGAMRPLDPAAVRWIVVHTAADRRGGDTTAADIHRWHRERGWAGIGYQYLVRASGDLEIGRPTQWQGAHALGLNGRSIGICLSGHGDHAAPSAAQRWTLRRLLPILCTRYDVPAENVIGHREVNDLVAAGELAADYRTDKSCPGAEVNMHEIRADLEEQLRPTARLAGDGLIGRHSIEDSPAASPGWNERDAINRARRHIVESKETKRDRIIQYATGGTGALLGLGIAFGVLSPEQAAAVAELGGMELALVEGFRILGGCVITAAALFGIELPRPPAKEVVTAREPAS